MRRFFRLILAALSLSVPVCVHAQEAREHEVHRGGTLRLVAAASGGTLDPQINYSAQYINLLDVVYDGLLSFRKVRGPAGNEIVADLAEEVPVPQDGGRTWVFTLRKNIRFSDGRLVTVRDVAASIRRIFKAGSPTSGSFYAGIKGADLCLREPDKCTLAEGVVTDPVRRTITFHLSSPDTEFLQKMAFPHACILPEDTPARDMGNTPIPGTGPYKITSYDPARSMKLERNPWFRVWNSEAQPAGYVDDIAYTFGVPNEAAVTAIENGQYDLYYDPIPLDRLGELGARYSDRTHIELHPQALYAFMNVNIPPFNSLAARQAVNYALDRRAMVIFYGGRAVAAPLCGMVPTSLPGHETPCLYSAGAPVAEWRAPDMERARELVRQSGTEGQSVTLLTSSGSVETAMGNYLRDTLQRLGYRATLRTLSPGIFFSYIQNSSNRMQIAIKSWGYDYPSPSNFLDTLFGCGNFHPGSDSSINMSGFCDRAIQSIMDRAKTEVSLTDSQRLDLWREAGRKIMEQAPAAPMIEMHSVKIHSARVGNYFYTPVYEILVSQLWVR